jgi:hypothetical protein
MIAGTRPIVSTSVSELDAHKDAADADAYASGKGCPICMAPLPAPTSTQYVRTPCNHEFCMPCINRLVRTAHRNKCPVCRGALSSDFIESLSEAEDDEENRAWLRDVRTHLRQSVSGAQQLQPESELPAVFSDEEERHGNGVVEMLVGNSHDAIGTERLGVDGATLGKRHRWTLYVRSLTAEDSDGRGEQVPLADFVQSVEVAYQGGAEGDSGLESEVVKDVLRGPSFEWVQETRRPVLVRTHITGTECGLGGESEMACRSHWGHRGDGVRTVHVGDSADQMAAVDAAAGERADTPDLPEGRGGGRCFGDDAPGTAGEGGGGGGEGEGVALHPL